MGGKVAEGPAQQTVHLSRPFPSTETTLHPHPPQGRTPDSTLRLKLDVAKYVTEGTK